MSRGVSHDQRVQAIVHVPPDHCVVRKHDKLTQAQMTPLMGMSVSGYRKWEQGKRNISGPATALLRIIESEPDVVKRVLVIR
jgi:putative transcriptional regulator